MKQATFFPEIVNVTDLRYRWTQVVKILQKNQSPVLVMEHSKPKAVLLSFKLADASLGMHRKLSPLKDPLFEWRKKHAHKLLGWDATTAVRKARDKRWKLS